MGPHPIQKLREREREREREERGGGKRVRSSREHGWGSSKKVSMFFFSFFLIYIFHVLVVIRIISSSFLIPSSFRGTPPSGPPLGVDLDPRSLAPLI